MLTTRTKQTTLSNIIRYLLLFVLLIGFSFSNPDKTNINPNQDKETILQKLESREMSFLENEEDLLCLYSMIKNEEMKSLENSNNNSTLKLTRAIYKKFNDPNYENTQIERINEILTVLIKKISEISENDIINEVFNEAILNLIGIYSIFKDKDLKFENFNEKIIPIAKKIIINENEKYEKKNFLRIYIKKKCIDFTKNKNFFFNLAKNIELKELFITIVNEFIIFETEYAYIDYYIKLLDNYLNFYDLEDIDNYDIYKKVYFEIIDRFLKYYIEMLDTGTFKNESFQFLKFFLNHLFLSQFYLKNITNFESLIDTFNKIANYEFDIIKNGVNSLSIYTILFYTNYIATLSKENVKKFSKIIIIFEKNINKYIILINLFEISEKKYIYNCSFNEIKNYFNYCKIKFENYKFYHLNLINNIKISLQKYIKKILIFQFIKIGFNKTKIDSNNISKFLENNYIYNKNELSLEILIQIEKLFPKTFKIQELTEKKIFPVFYVNILINIVIKHEFFNINIIKDNINLVIKLLENFNKILKSDSNIEDNKFFIVFSFYIMNFIKKSNIEESSKKDFLEKLNKLLTFETETQEFIDNKVGKDYGKLSIVNFIYSIKESYFIFEKLEELNEENFKAFMINFIDNFKKLCEFLIIENKYFIIFIMTFYYDFIKIFENKIVNKDNIDRNYWELTNIRIEIYQNFEKKSMI